MSIIDLRSDTLTQPTDAMREAMASASVGDDVFGEDPTVNRLEQIAAAAVGKEAAVFVASGTMANLVSQMAHCQRGDEMIVGDQSHIFYYEQGGSAALGGIHPRPVVNRPDGTLSLEAVEEAIRVDDIHFPRTRLIALENTHNRCCGSPLGEAYLAEVAALASRHDLRIHMDGARLFNAAAALGVGADRLARFADSVSFCLSKGLAAPVGSLVCGSTGFAARARRIRKALGGGMRQAGVLAAAGIVALEQMVDRLGEDHRHARLLARGLAGIPGVGIDLECVRTNLVFFEIDRPDLSAQTLVERLEQTGIRMLAVGPRRIRAVTHYHIEDKDIPRVIGQLSSCLQE